MSEEAWRILARFDPYDGAHSVLIRKGTQVARLVFEDVQPGSFVTPTIDANLGGDPGGSFLRAALNCAWELGLRPDGFNDTRESIAATKAHLNDMRALAFHKIGAAKPD